MDENTTAKGRFDAAGHCDGVAPGIDDRQVAGARRFQCHVGTKRGARADRLAWRCAAHAAPGPHQGRALAQVGGIDQPCRRHRHEIRIADIVVAVGVGEAPRFGEQMHRAAGARPHPGHRKTLQQPEDRQHRDAAGTRRRHAADAVRAVAAADRIAFERAIAGEVLFGEIAGTRVDAHRHRDVARDVALVERIRSLVSDAAQ